VLVSVGHGGVSMVSIPRDLWVPIPGHGEGRINTAYRVGELERRGGGPSLAERTVESALGLHVDRYALVDMAGVRDVVDQLGGIEVDNPTILVDDQFPTDDYGVTTITIPAGRQHLNGELALAYARTRHPDSDFGRMGRQQQVIAAILAKLRGPSGVLRAPAVLGVIQKATRSDMTTADYVTLGPSALDLSGDRVRRLVIGPELVTPLTGSDGAALLQPTPKLRSAVASFLNGTP
jgi:polyisoprenyl-teichoic acid--peptidoglycan teichoic acid transferase